MLVMLRRGDCGNYFGCLLLLTSEERRHNYTPGRGVSIGVRGRRVPGPIVLLSVQVAKYLMAVKQLSV
jgi:hypothetical protein